jgi:hypothetical protein
MRWEALILQFDGSVVGRCLLVNVSDSGARLIMSSVEDVPDCFELVLSKKGEVRRQCEVTWRREKSIGVRFIRPGAVAAEEVSHISDTLARFSSKSLVKS